MVGEGGSGGSRWVTRSPCIACIYTSRMVCRDLIRDAKLDGGERRGQQRNEGLNCEEM